MFKSILVLCLGNICRSPVAEGILRQHIAKRQLDVVVSSAGVTAMVDYPADPFSIAVAEQNGIDIASHRARQITTDLVNQHDLILVTDEEVRRIMAQRYPHALGKVKKIGHFQDKDIADPYMQPKHAFDAMYRDLDACLDEWVKKIF
jgi:protein-tyrosine phosphatase